MVLAVLVGIALVLFGIVRSRRVREAIVAAVAAPVATPEARFVAVVAFGYWAAMLAARSVMGFMALSTRMMMPVYPLLLIIGVAIVVGLVGAIGPSARRALPWVVVALSLGATVGVIAPKSLALGGPRLRPDPPPPWVVWVATNTLPGAPIVGNGGFDYTFYLERPVLSFASYLEYRSGNRFERDCRMIARHLAQLGWRRPYLVLRAEEDGLDPDLMTRRYGPTIGGLLKGSPTLPARQVAREREFAVFEILGLDWSCVQD